MSKRSEFQTFTRLRRVAQAELQSVMSALPDEIAQAVHGLDIRFEDRPVGSDATSLAAGRTLTIYLMNMFTRHGAVPGEFRSELRRLLVTELAGMAGVDVTWGEL